MSNINQLLNVLDKARLASESKTQNVNALANADAAHDMSNNTVTKSHALSRAYYRLGLVEKRCMEGLISKLHPLRGDNDLQEIELTGLEYSKAYNISEKIAYRDIGHAVEALMHRVITVDRQRGKPGKVELTVMLKAEYKDDEGCISCAFNPFIVPHLIGLREKFSSYPLSKAVNFSSSYTWRFYEILVSWAQPKNKTNGQFMGWIDRQSVIDLREMLGVPKSYSWNMLETRVLNIAQTELLNKANIHITFERIKTGRKITHLNIKFIEDNQQQLPF